MIIDSKKYKSELIKEVLKECSLIGNTTFVGDYFGIPESTIRGWKRKILIKPGQLSFNFLNKIKLVSKKTNNRLYLKIN